MEKQDSIAFGIAILKYLSIGIGSISGVIGLFVEFKNKRTHKITKNGYSILVLIISSGLISGVLQTLELYKEKKESQETAQRALMQSEQNNTILRNINRTLNPIKDVYLNYWIEIPTDNPEIKAYTNRISNNWKSIVVNNLVRDANTLYRQYGIYVSQSNSKSVERIAILPNSSFFPSQNDEKVAFTLLSYLDISVSFYKGQSSDKSVRDKKPDLSFPFIFTGINKEANSGKHELEFDVNSKKLYLIAFSVYCDPKYWEKTGQILGTTDFPGSKLEIEILNTMSSGDQQTDRKMRVIRGKYKLQTIKFNMSEGRQFWIRENKLKRMSNKSGLAQYSFVFPDRDDVLSTLQ